MAFGSDCISLNPFFIRSIVQSLAARSAYFGIGLNPFFIRSIVQSFAAWMHGKSLGLNPFFIRSIVQSDTIESLWGERGLNPFFIRSIVQSLLLATSSEAESLNPFFIRSIVQSRTEPTKGLSQVLIPSSSGQSFNPRVDISPFYSACYRWLSQDFGTHRIFLARRGLLASLRSASCYTYTVDAAARRLFKPKKHDLAIGGLLAKMTSRSRICLTTEAKGKCGRRLAVGRSALPGHRGRGGCH